MDNEIKKCETCNADLVNGVCPNCGPKTEETAETPTEAPTEATTEAPTTETPTA